MGQMMRHVFLAALSVRPGLALKVEKIPRERVMFIPQTRRKPSLAAPLAERSAHTERSGGTIATDTRSTIRSVREHSDQVGFAHLIGRLEQPAIELGRERIHSAPS